MSFFQACAEFLSKLASLRHVEKSDFETEPSRQMEVLSRSGQRYLKVVQVFTQDGTKVGKGGATLTDVSQNPAHRSRTSP